MLLGNSQPFTAAGTGTTHTNVTWRVNSVPGGTAATGTFSGTRPTTQEPDAPLGDDDRTDLRVLYPDPTDTANVGSICGRILPASPLSLPASPPGVTGIFGANVVAVDAASGAVIGATLGGWSCTAPGPVQFDGSYSIAHLPLGRSYQVYAEPLDNTVFPSLSPLRRLRFAAIPPPTPAGRPCKRVLFRR